MGVVGVTQHTEHVAQLVMTLACSSMGMAAGVASRGSVRVSRCDEGERERLPSSEGDGELESSVA